MEIQASRLTRPWRPESSKRASRDSGASHHMKNRFTANGQSLAQCHCFTRHVYAKHNISHETVIPLWRKYLEIALTEGTGQARFTVDQPPRFAQHIPENRLRGHSGY